VSIEEQHVALPKLYGAPAYGRPPRPVEDVERPFDPDELPIEAVRTEEEQEFVATLPPEVFAPGGISIGRNGGETTTGADLQPRTFSLRAMAGRLLGGN
jgi:hypothetical protein